MLKNRGQHYLIRGLCFLSSIFVFFFIAEVATRILFSQPLFEWKDYRGPVCNLYRSALPVQPHETLGWIPQTGYSSNHTIWGKQVTILENGIRSNGNKRIVDSSSSILVVGDSFTFGDQVSDHETWPAILEKKLSRPVINAGVFAYGLDQSFLRLKSLISRYKASAIIFSFIPDDIYRCEYSVTFGANKPFFSVTNSTLSLKGVPVRTREHKTHMIFQILGHSYFIHRMMMKLNPSWWLSGNYALNENPTGYRGKDIGCLIFKELEKIVKTNRIRAAYILVQDTQPSTSSADVDDILSCINKKVFHVIDMRKSLSEIKSKDRWRYQSFFDVHMTASGNEFVAETVAAQMHHRP